MRSFVLHIGTVFLAAVFMPHSLRGEDGGHSIPEGIVEFTGELVEKHQYLFSETDRGQLQELNGKIGESNQKRNKAKSEEEKQQAGRDLSAAAEKLLAMVDKCPGLIAISFGEKDVLSSLSGPVQLPGDFGALLLRIDQGQGTTQCTTIPNDMVRETWDRHVIQVSAKDRGRTWVIISLSGVTAGKSALLVEFEKPDGGKARWMLEVVAPVPGHIRLAVLSADTGRAAPAMIRIRPIEPPGPDRRPSNAVDFEEQLDRCGGWEGARRANLPGRLRGPYWCVPGPFDMPLPAGRYEIVVRRGMEHLPVFDTISVEAGKQLEKAYTPQRWVNMAGHGWYSGDGHVHCRILSDADAGRLMTWVQAEDVRIANVVKMGDINRTWFDQRGFGPEYRVAGEGHVLAPSQECPRTHEQLGHTISMNVKEMVRDIDRYYLYDWVADRIHAQGGLWGYAHVYSDMFFVHRDMSMNIPKGKCDFVELLQFGRFGTDLYYEFLNLGFKLTAVAGSDVPWGGTVGEVRFYAYIGNEPFTPDSWFDAVRKGRTFVTNGPMIDFRVENALPGDEITVRENRSLKVRVRTWGDLARVVPRKLEIVRHGEVMWTVEPSDGQETELTAEFEVDAGNGFWIAARVEGSDGAWAHTTPVYVVREGLRFWKFDQIDELIAKRRSQLGEVDELLVDALRRNEAGEVEADRRIKLLARLNPELVERVLAARQLYEELEATAGKERARREKAD